MKRDRAAVRLFALVLAGSLVAAGTAQAWEMPYSATHDVPDYAATMVGRSDHGQRRTFSRTILHHQGSMRVDEAWESGRVTYYGHSFGDEVLAAPTGADGEFTGLFIRKVHPSRDHTRIRNVEETSNYDHQAGERCRWIKVTRGTADGQGVTNWADCLSNDGIEVAKRGLSRDGSPSLEANLVRLERRLVAISEVAPPPRLFDPSFWLTPLRDYSTIPAIVDFEVNMLAPKSELRILRHYPWWLEDERHQDGAANFTVWNELENQGIRINVSNGDRHLQASRLPFDPNRPLNSLVLRTGKFERTDREEWPKDANLVEPCEWFTMVPAVNHVSHQQCQTGDGIPIRDIRKYEHGLQFYSAVSVVRRTVKVEEMFPPATMMDATAWGFPPSTDLP